MWMFVLSLQSRFHSFHMGSVLFARCFYLPLISHDLYCAGTDVLLDAAERDQSAALGALAQSACPPALSLCLSYCLKLVLGSYEGLSNV